MKVVVTGGAGYIGRVMVPHLRKLGHEVTVIDRLFLTYDNVRADYSNLGVRLLRDDIRYFDPNILKGQDAVVDLAALSNDPSGAIDPIKTWEINYLGRARVARLAKRLGVGKYVLASSCSVYGFQDGVADESSRTNPLTAYAEANLAAERDNLVLNDSTFCSTALRFATAYGRSEKMRYDLAINAMTLYGFRERKVRLMRDGDQFRPFVHVADISRAVSGVLDAPSEIVGGQVFNVGSDEQNVDMKSVADLVRRNLNNGSEIELYGDPDNRSYRVSFTRIAEALGFKPRMTIADGVQEISSSLRKGGPADVMQTRTVEFYKQLIKAEQVVQEYGYNNTGRIL